ncbi:hypothetical protein [Fodinicola acaciae]|uniref:hypothetical protein n=1 Tax=Fodinicola acaciae TaxID=2681555 RepID=UPI0013D8CBC6|nr:hypothetical protein [Fodinicola acaciae]
MATTVSATETHSALASAVAEAVLACPGVAGLRGGRFGDIATYLPGRRIDGVRLRPDGVTIGLAVHFGQSVFAVSAAVRLVVRDVIGDVPVDVAVDDVVAA